MHSIEQCTLLTSRNKLIVEHSGLVHRIARLLKYALPSSMEVSDLIQAGFIGLLQASKSFNPQQGAEFRTFAAIRIRGEMIDELRRQFRLPRRLPRIKREMDYSQRTIENEVGRPARQREIATRAGLSPAALANFLFYASITRIEDIDDYDVKSEDAASEPFSSLTDKEFRSALASALKKLSTRERIILRLYYRKEWTMEQIASHHQVSESRICQLKQQSIGKLRRLLAEWRGVDNAAMDEQRSSMDFSDIL